MRMAAAFFLAASSAFLLFFAIHSLRTWMHTVKMCSKEQNDVIASLIALMVVCGALSFSLSINTNAFGG